MSPAPPPGAGPAPGAGGAGPAYPWGHLLGRGQGPRAAGEPRFADTARTSLGHSAARTSRATAAAELRADRDTGRRAEPDWAGLRRAATAVRERALADLERHLTEFEKRAEAAGARVHWARDAAEAGRIVAGVAARAGTREAVRSSSATAGELRLDAHLLRAGITVHETAVADLIAGLAHEPPHSESRTVRRHDRAGARAVLARRLPGAPTDLRADPGALVAVAREYLRETLLEAGTAITGANALVAETGSVVAMETEGNVRMGAAVPRTLITVAGIDKVVPAWADIAVLARVWARSATGAAQAPVVSTWTGPVEGDGPDEVHVVLVDAGRSATLGDPVGRQALRCIQCTACLDVCPVFERTGAAPYGSVHAGPIGAALTPQLRGTASAREASLPFASTLCGACTEVCPVGVDIPEILLELRARVVDERRANAVPTPEALAAQSAEWVMAEERRFARAQRAGSRWARLLARSGRLRRLPGLLGRWTEARDFPVPPGESFRAWWARRRRALLLGAAIRPRGAARGPGPGVSAGPGPGERRRDSHTRPESGPE
ncbi:LUD domain-containing protein [Streptomonospora nanhaiensis]|uniref:LUD domain-containing protein n=2 Tax=Streptomonospora nanhaiensis TaxID=1323731 RepID=UPI001C39173A|nr:LUD domain-containing protein [Streptomonospora nanhaiensis]MBV2363372.1 LUD domain-containing protein [Streptomonospora nanhaiensis]MBX9389290.1 LUD domain-containing protein [Streptomonospora nanhaiensis]